MLPFLKPKRLASTILSHRKPNAPPEEHQESETHPKLMEHSESLISAVHAKDAAKVAEALRLAHEHLAGATHAPDEEQK